MRRRPTISSFFFNDTATTEIYTLSLHDALPICWRRAGAKGSGVRRSSSPARAESRRNGSSRGGCSVAGLEDRKSTRLNSSHANISYAVFCLKKNKSLFGVLFPDPHVYVAFWHLP